MSADFCQHQNWGKVGAGNDFISKSVVEAHLKNNFIEDDVVAIMWSSVARFDLYKNKIWHTPGNIYHQKYFNEEVVNFLADDRGFYIRDLAAIYMTQQLLDKIGCRYFMFSMVDITNPSDYGYNDISNDITDLLSVYQSTLKNIRPSVHKVVFNYDWFSRPFGGKKLQSLERHYNQVAGPDWPTLHRVVDDKDLDNVDKNILAEIFDLSRWNWKQSFHEHQRDDSHPTPIEHLEYLETVLPDWPISLEIRSIIQQIDHAIRNGLTVDPDLMSQAKKSQPITRW